MPHIFISYAKKDTRELALALADTLNEFDGAFTAWVDRSLRAGKSWELQIQQEIDRCDVMVVLYSPDINRHKQGEEESYVLTEIAYAKYEAKKRIIPVMAQKTTPPMSLTALHYIDFTRTGLTLDNLVDAILDELETPAERRQRMAEAAQRRQQEAAQAESERLQREEAERIEQAAERKPQEDAARQALINEQERIAREESARQAQQPSTQSTAPVQTPPVSMPSSAPKGYDYDPYAPKQTNSYGKLGSGNRNYGTLRGGVRRTNRGLARLQPYALFISLVGIGLLGLIVLVLPNALRGIATPSVTPTLGTTSTPDSLQPTFIQGTFIQGANLRSGPSNLFDPPIGSYASGQTVDVIAQNPAGDWYKVSGSNGEGWVLGELITISGDVSTILVDAGPPVPTFTPSSDPLEVAAAYDYRAGNIAWTPISANFDDVTMMLVPPGCFMMGSEDGKDDEKPVHEQCFEEPFWIDQTEVTQADFERLGGVKANENSFDGDQRPIERITWFEAHDFCALRGARLPTEAEWEYAARGPDALIYPWGNDFVRENVVYTINSDSQTGEVGSRASGASWVGAFDLSGNVWEWVSSLYLPYDSTEDREADTGDRTDLWRVLRGGSFFEASNNLRSAIRAWVNPDHVVYGINGFRCALDAEGYNSASRMST